MPVRFLPRGKNHKLGRKALTAGLAALAVTGTLVAAAPAALAQTNLPAGSPLPSFVSASLPQWNFARANSRDTCWPSAAIDASGAQSPSASRKAWPTAGQGGCPDRWSPFPTYYTVKQCGADQVRVIFNIYFKKDGFSGNLAGNALGHGHDFEHIVLVWNRIADGSWARDHLLLGRHGDHVYQGWATAESWLPDFSSAGLGYDHPRIFVGWGKHAMFNHQGGLKDVASQFTDNEYRHADFPYLADNLQEVTDDNAPARQFDSFNWGSASSTPAVMSRSLCSITANR